MKPRKSFEQKLIEFKQLRQQADSILQRYIDEMNRDELRRFVKRITNKLNSSGTPPQQGKNNE